MKNYIVTGFNEDYVKWGAAWLASLYAFAKYKGEVLVFDFGLPNRVKAKIESMGAKTIQTEYTGDYRSDIFKSIAKLSQSEDALFAYWDADVQFQTPIDEIFELAKNKLICSTHAGFLAGPSYQWLFVQNIIDTCKFLDVKDDLYLISNQYYSNFLTKIEDTWNYSNIAKLKNIDGFLYAKEELIKVVHVPNNFKMYAMNRGVFFWERHENLYNQIYDSKKINLRKLMKPTQSFSN